MFTGTLIDELIATVERAEQHSNLLEIMTPEIREYRGTERGESQQTWVGVA